jgi:hypothetical protein
MSIYAWSSIEPASRLTTGVWSDGAVSVTRIAGQRDTIVIPAFSLAYTETDTYMPFIVGEFSISMSSAFAVLPMEDTTSWVSYTLGVRDDAGQHFILQRDGGAEQLPAGIPHYEGETLSASVVFEIWSSPKTPYNGIAESATGLTLQTSLFSTVGTSGTTNATSSVDTNLFATGTPTFSLPITFDSPQS